MLPSYMSPKDLISDTHETFRASAEEGLAKTSKFQDGGCSSNAISGLRDFVWVNPDIVLNLSTHFQPVINLFRLFYLIGLDYKFIMRTILQTLLSI